MDEDWVRRGWEWQGRDLRVWVDYGVKLLKAAEWVEQGFNEKDDWGRTLPRAVALMGPMMMLKGMAIECLMKAIAAKNSHRFDVDGNLVTNHDLVALAGHWRVGFAPEEDETNLLERLSYSIRTFGRYPMVGGEDGWKKGFFGEVKKGSAEFVAWMYWSSMDVGIFDRLWHRMLGVVHVECDEDGSVVFRSMD